MTATTLAMNIQYRLASLADVAVLAPMNAQLIRDEGHRNSMSVPQLAERMTAWLQGEYQGYLFEIDSTVIGYALYRADPEFVYLRQLFVQTEFRRRGVARRALEWLREHAWHAHPRIRIEVLVSNEAGIEFWKSAGFTDYCLTMERSC